MSREMKESNIKWIGKMPSNWNISKHKYVMHKEKIICDKYNGEDILSLSVNGVIVRDLDAGGKMPTSFDGYQEVVPGDLLMCLFDIDVTPRCVGLIQNKGLTSPAYSRFHVHEGYYAGYYDYLLRTIDDKKVFVHLSKNLRNSLTETDFGSLPTIVPPYEEQVRITNFLDNKCDEIDKVIYMTEESIDKYKTLKNSIINNAVTRGVDSNVECIESGIDWIKKLPKGWKSINPKALFSLRKEKAFEGERQLTASQQYGVIYQDDYMSLTGSKIVVVEKDFSILKHVEKGDFVIRMRSFQGGLEYSENSGSISSAYVMLIPDLEKINPRYYKWLFKSQIYINALQSTSNLVRDGQAMRYSNFAQVRLFEVPLEEQGKIADYLDKKCPEIDRLIERKQNFLKKLKDYKEAMIFEYVTGKKEVSDCY